MPHLTMQYSANLEMKADIDRLCTRVHAVILETGLFELGAIRVRALTADHYAIADRLAENAFIDMVFRIGRGRSEEDKTRTGEAIFAAAVDELTPLFATPHFALSLEIVEIDSDLSWKKNAIHPRLRGQ